MNICNRIAGVCFFTLVICSGASAYEFTAAPTYFDGQSAIAQIEGVGKVVLFGERGKVYCNIAAKANCPFLTFEGEGSRATQSEYCAGSLIGKNEAGEIVCYAIETNFDKEKKTLSILKFKVVKK